MAPSTLPRGHHGNPADRSSRALTSSCAAVIAGYGHLAVPQLRDMSSQTLREWIESFLR
jgi:hypothetical protein